MLIVEDAKVLSNTEIAPNFYVLEFLSPKIAKAAKPGQFINIRVSDRTDPLLRRPISIYNTEKDHLKILYFVKGKGTKILKSKKPGDKLSITGPHGNGFTVKKDAKNILLVGGGFGTAPLAFLAKRANDGFYEDKNIFVAIGGRTKELILCRDDFKKLDAKVFLTTDDGSCGKKGLVTCAVEEILKKNKIDQIFTVGPLVMMGVVAEIAEANNIPAQVSMEERMACGVGACYGCACRTKKGYETVCENGPVFNSKELVL